MEEAVAELCSYPHVEEAGILSTCNRMEIYVVALSWHRGVREVEEWMSRYSGSPSRSREHLFLLRDQDATSHLLKVSGGLDSVVMGEGQILAQVKNVFALGENVPGSVDTSPVCSRLPSPPVSVCARRRPSRRARCPSPPPRLSSCR